jgi:hypothetical protein
MHFQPKARPALSPPSRRLLIKKTVHTVLRLFQYHPLESLLLWELADAMKVLKTLPNFQEGRLIVRGIALILLG